VEGTNRLTDAQFPRPYGVERAESLRLVQAHELTEPTLREAAEMTVEVSLDGEPAHWVAFSELALGSLRLVADYSRAKFTWATSHRGRELYYRRWRGAEIVLASREQLGGPIHA